MNILIIGNGFDLAHGMKTKYSDFLETLYFYNLKGKLSESILEEKEIEKINTSKECSKKIEELNERINKIFLKEDISASKVAKEMLREKNKILRSIEKLEEVKKYYEKVSIDKISKIEKLEEIKDDISNNVWCNYLYDIYNKNQMRGENWIDFEKEIRDIIEIIDKHENNLKNNIILSKIEKLIEDEIMDREKLKKVYNFIDYYLLLHTITKGEKENYDISNINFSYYLRRDTLQIFLKKIYDDLNKFINYLEIYLLELEKDTFNLRSKDIQNLKIDKVLCFNYTHTFSKLYDKENKKEICYIHGEIEENREAKFNNMVLGIDEYYDDERKNTNTNFNIFKKFTQRIIKKTDLKYRDWLEYMDKENHAYAKGYGYFIHNIYVFGHSLDITDKDILKDFIDKEYVLTTIYYYDKQQQTQQVANLVKLLGQDKFLRMFKEKRIEFKEQSEIVKI